MTQKTPGATVPLATTFAIKKKDLPGSIASLSGSIPVEAIAAKRDAAIRRLGQDLELPGFRKGHAPAEMVVQRFGELAILEESAGIVLQEAIPDLLAEESVPLIAPPRVNITKLAPGNPVDFTIEVPVMPKISLPDYRKAARKAVAKLKEDKMEVTDSELAETLKKVRATIAEWKRRKTETPSDEAHDDHDHTGHDHHDHDHAHGGVSKEEPAELPELTDEDVKLVGDYKDVTDFTEKMKLSILSEKEAKARDKRRAAIAEALIEGTKTDIPEVFIEEELEVMLGRFERDVEGMGMKFDQYLEHIKKTPEDVKKDWRDDARKRVTLELALGKIAEAEKIEIPPADLDRETKRYMASLENADENMVRDRVRHLLRNEEIFKLLEREA